MPLTKFVENLCGKLELFVSAVNKHFSFQEIEVFNLNHNFFQEIFADHQSMKKSGHLRSMTLFASQIELTLMSRLLIMEKTILGKLEWTLTV
jgi:hypothetical protein